jgi:hypothetical protein
MSAFTSVAKSGSAMDTIKGIGAYPTRMLIA